MKNNIENQLIHDRLMISGGILAHWQHPVSSSEALNLLHWAMQKVYYWRIAMTIGMASKVGIFFYCCCFEWDKCHRRGDMERVFALWRHPVASNKALDVLLWGMRTVLHPCLRMAINMAHNGGTFVRHCCLFCMIVRS
jgi:hypothetical protein